MEFRNCPACKASVLEDDAEDCPFCGASMSGKPSAKPTPRPAAKPSPAAVKPTGAVAPKGATPSKVPGTGAVSRPRPEPEPEKPADDADPFEVDPLAHKQAVQLSIKAGKGRTIEVKCPMCETVGFMAPSQAGKDVKCCNPGCKLPIFRSPKLPAEVQAEPEKSRGLSTGMIALLALLGVGVFGGGIYWFVLRDVPKPKEPALYVPGTNSDPIPEPDTPGNVVKVPEKHLVSTIEEIRTLSLQDILKITVQHTIRSKPLGRQLAAQALLSTGDRAGAKEQISKMGSNANVGQYAVEPLALLAQSQLDAGDKAGAEASLKEALDKSAKLPNVLRSHLDGVVVLAATLVRFDRTPEAAQLLERFSRKDGRLRAELSELWRTSIDQGTFDFSRQLSLSHLELCGDPLWVATTVHLCRHGQWDAAVAWSRKAPDAVTQDASLAACAGMMASRLHQAADPALDAKMKATIQAGGPAARVRMQIAVAEVRWQSGDKSITAATVTENEQLLASTLIPSVMEAPGIKAIYDSKGVPFAGLPDPGPGTSLALAMADIGDLQMKLGDTAGGWAQVNRAMEMLRSVSPSPAAAQQLFDQCNTNSDGVKAQLDTALKLGGDGSKRLRALSQYRSQCEVILGIANDRFAIQQTLLRRSLRYGLFTEVWEFMQSGEQAELNSREPYRSSTNLLLYMYYNGLAQGKEEFMTRTWKEISAEEQSAISAAEATVGVLGSAAKVARTGGYRKAAEVLKPLYLKSLVDRNLIDRHVLEQVSTLTATSIPSCYSYVQRLSDETIREDAMRMMAGLSIRLGKGPELWKLIEEDHEIPVTDKAAAYLGFLEGIQASPAQAN